MKTLHIVILLWMALILMGAEYVPVTVTLDDGSAVLRPDSAKAYVYYHDDVFVDSLIFDTTADWVSIGEAGFCQDSVSSDSTGGWYTIHYYIEKGSEIFTASEEWHAKYDANVWAISDDQTSADSLERMLDGTGATLRLSQLNIVADGNKSAIVAAGSGTGHGMDIDGGASGYGQRITGGATSGYGVLFEAASGNAPGLAAVGSGTNPGARFQGGLTGNALQLTAGATSGDGIGFSITSGDHIDLGSNEDLVDTILAILDTIQDGAGININYEKVWYDIDTTNIDTSELGEWFSTGISATVSDANMAAIADSVWQAGFEEHDGTAGSFADSAKGWGATAATGLTQDGILGAMRDSGFVQYNRQDTVGRAAGIMHLGGLIVVDSTPDDTAAFYVSGDSNAVEFNAPGSMDALRLITSSGRGLYAYAGGTAGKSAVFGVGTSGNSTTRAVHIYNNGDGDGVRIECGNANDTGTALGIYHAGNDSAEWASYKTYAIQTEGGTYIHGRDDRDEHAMHIAGQNAGYGFYVTGAGQHGARFSSTDSLGVYVANGMRIADSLYVVGDIIADTIHAWVDSVDYVKTVDTVLKTIVSSGGSGSNTIRVYAIDTSTTPDDTVAGVWVEVQDLTGSLWDRKRTSSGGYLEWSATATDTFNVTGHLVGYSWTGINGAPSDSLDQVIVAANDTVDLYGYNIDPGSPGAANLCRLYDDVYDIQGNAVEDARVTVTLTKNNVRDSCTGVSIADYRADTVSNSSGRWTVDLIKSLCLKTLSTSTDTVYYKVVVTYPWGEERVARRYYVPDSTSHKMVW